MTERMAVLAAAFDRARPRLIRIAYTTLGSYVEAEDVVADTWPRLMRADARQPILDVDAWATVTVARAALDALRSARIRRESYVGPWLPEPIVGPIVGSDGGVDRSDPADAAVLDEAVSYALLVVLEALTPAERTAWVLHDLFGVPFPDVALAVGRTPAAVRQLASRARAHVSARSARVPVDAVQHDAAVRRFRAATLGGDLTALLAALDPDVVLTTDGGGVVRAARRPILGADKVGRFLLGVAPKWAARGVHLRGVAVNGAAGLAIIEDRRLIGTLSFVVAGGAIRRIDMVRAPDKLPTLRLHGAPAQPAVAS